MILEFTIPGKITSANRVTRHVGRMALKSESARLDHARIRSHATAAVLGGKWVIPERATVLIDAYNSRIDADNLPKCILDGIKGIAIVNDSPKHLPRLFIYHIRDKGGERYTIRVESLLPSLSEALEAR